LGLDIWENLPFTMADGTIGEVPMTSPIEVRFNNHNCTVHEFVLSNIIQPVLGTIALNSMDFSSFGDRREPQVHSDLLFNLRWNG
jgi:hypothetical protein